MIATLAVGLTIVPISASNGRSGAGGAKATSFGGGVAIGAVMKGGRRETENNGRPRVSARALSGKVDNGLSARDFEPGSSSRGTREGPAASTRSVPSLASADTPSTSSAGRRRLAWTCHR